MILQPASQKEVKRIAIGSGICACIQVAVFWLLSLVGVGSFRWGVVIGTLGGTAMAILNFALMCITLQKATANASDEKLVKAKVRNGYNLRKIIQILWVIAAFFLPGVNVLAAAIPLFFPNVVIYYLQIKGKLYSPEDAAPNQPSTQPAGQDDAEQGDEDLGPFEA